jgi:hypothetical protein
VPPEDEPANRLSPTIDPPGRRAYTWVFRARHPGRNQGVPRCGAGVRLPRIWLWDYAGGRFLVTVVGSEL